MKYIEKKLLHGNKKSNGNKESQRRTGKKNLKNVPLTQK